MNNKSIIKREISIDILRIISCFLIILRHVTDNSKLINDHWRTAIILKSISYPALLIFVMMTGYLIFDKEESYRSFFKKRFSKIFLPFLFWSLIYREYYVRVSSEPMKRDFINAFLSDGSSYHLGYVYFIIGVYLVVPMIRKMFKNISNKDLIYLITLWIMTTSIFPIIKDKYQIAIKLDFIFKGYWGYILGGYLIKRLKNDKKYFKNSLFIAISIYLITLIGTICFNKGKEMILDYLNIVSIPMIILCFSLFYVVKYSSSFIDRLISDRIKNIIINISNLTFTIYLAHAVILDIFLRGVLGFRIDPRIITPIFGAILLALLIFVICLIIALILDKIKIILLIVFRHKNRI